MGRERRPRGLFEYRDHWIDREPGRAGFYQYWYDVESRRVKRKAIHGEDVDEASTNLINILGAPLPIKNSPDQVWLFDVLDHYRDSYAKPKGYKQMAAAKRAGDLVYAAFKSFLGTPRVSDLTRTNQQRIWKYLSEDYRLSAKSIMTYMISIRAAINYAAVPQIVRVNPDDPENNEKAEVQLLSHGVSIFCNQEEIAEYIGGSVSTPRDYIPTFAALGKWIDAIEDEDDFRFVIIMLNTCARNEAIFELEVSRQVDFEYGTIDLNPPGRRQTKKRRPIIRMTTNLAGWLQHWKDDKPIRQYQDTVEKRLNKLGKPILNEDGEVVSEGLGMPQMTCYTLRHFMATNMRRVSFPVSKEQRSKWLGHTVNEGSKTTDWYEKFDPDYLEEPMRATDEIIRKIQKHTRRKLFAPTVRSQGKLRVVK